MNQNIYKPPIHHVHGRLLKDPRRHGRHALLLRNPTPNEEGPDSFYLRYAFLLLGNEKPVFPGMILDDWGAEIKGIKMYRWVRENGDAFPRAEIFGMNLEDEGGQYFVRELDLTLKIRIFGYANKNGPLSAGRAIQNVLLPHEEAKAPIKRRRPSGIKRPITGTRVNYWEVPIGQEAFDFQLFDLEE